VSRHPPQGDIATQLRGPIYAPDGSVLYDPATDGAIVTQSQVGAADGLATLDGTGNVPLGQLGNVGKVTVGAATPTVMGLVLIDESPASGDPVAVTTPRIGAAGGIASLDANGNVPASQLGNAPPNPVASPSTSGTVKVAQAPPAGGSATVSDILAGSIEQTLSSTAATQIFTLTPLANGRFALWLTAGVITAATEVTATLTWTNARGAQTYNFWNADTLPVADNAAVPYFFSATTAGPITLTVTAGTASQVAITSSLEAK